MDLRRLSLIAILIASIPFPGPAIHAQSAGIFEAPLSIHAVWPMPRGASIADFDLDGKLDLALEVGEVLLQDRNDRRQWRRVSLKTDGNYVRSADFDGDGFDDVVLARTARAGSFNGSLGDGTFKPPFLLPLLEHSYSLAMGDWDA